MQSTRITSAQSRAHEILKYSPLLTDAYFHYTPSQIMLAALSLADRGLADRVVHETFHHPSLTSTDHDAGHQTKDSNRNRGTTAAAAAAARAALGAEARDRVLDVVAACRDVLAREPPERMAGFWGTPDSNQIARPLLRKLRRCRDPDRWDLVALQKARREMAARKEGVEDGGVGGGTVKDDGTVFGDAIDDRDTKRRKVEAGKDPFGGML